MHLDEMVEKDFKALLGLLEYLPTSDMIMEYRFLLGEIAKNNCREFVFALVDVIQDS